MKKPKLRHIIYSISHNYMTTNRRNPISGHCWTTSNITRGFNVTGGFLIERNFSSIPKAEEAIRFDVKFAQEKFTHEISYPSSPNTQLS